MTDTGTQPSGATASGPTASGDAAVAAAAERATETAGLNIPNLSGLPLPIDTANLRLGPDLHHGLLALLPLVGVWRGEGEADTIERGQYRFGQQITVSHDGENYLSWESRSWVIDADGTPSGADMRESGFWRISEDDVIEFLLTHSSGSVEMYYGRPLNERAWEVSTDVVIRSATGPEVGPAKRLYGLVENNDLGWVEERVRGDEGLVPRMSARLRRHIG